MRNDLVMLITVSSAFILLFIVVFSIMAHLIKTFYSTTQESLREQAVLRKRNDRLNYELTNALTTIQKQNNQVLTIKKDLEYLTKKYESAYKDGRKKGIDEINEQLKVIKN